MNTCSCSALVSIHDVMPSTLGHVEYIFAVCQKIPVYAITLLVVPGRQWSETSLNRLRDMVAGGANLAGHGWRHEVDITKLKTFNARLHSTLISRNVAEHLALDEAGIEALVSRCYHWFPENNLPEPTLYVPPAWAMGTIRRERLNQLPFRYYETLFGVYDNLRRKFSYSPLVGYEADTRFRAYSLLFWNGINRKVSDFHSPLRLGIHPYDFEYRMSARIQRDLESFSNFVTYGD